MLKTAPRKRLYKKLMVFMLTFSMITQTMAPAAFAEAPSGEAAVSSETVSASSGETGGEKTIAEITTNDADNASTRSTAGGSVNEGNDEGHESVVSIVDDDQDDESAGTAADSKDTGAGDNTGSSSAQTADNTGSGAAGDANETSTGTGSSDADPAAAGSTGSAADVPQDNSAEGDDQSSQNSGGSHSASGNSGNTGAISDFSEDDVVVSYADDIDPSLISSDIAGAAVTEIVPEESLPEEEIISQTIIETVNMPEQSFTAQLGTVFVRASVDEGVFPEDVSMRARLVSGGTKLEKIKDAVQNDILEEEEEISDIIAVDISFLDSERNELQPAIEDGVHVTISIGREMEGDTFKVAHIDDNYQANEVSADVVPEAADKTVAEFDAGEFSVYAVIGTTGSEAQNAKARYTYIFKNGEEEFSRQIVKNGESLLDPGIPVSADGTAFTGWMGEDGNLLTKFGTVTVEGNEDKELVYTAQFGDKYYSVVFYDTDGNVFTVKTGNSGDEIDISGVELTMDPVMHEAHIGWSLTKGGEKTTNDAVTIGKADIELYPVIVPAAWVVFEVGDGVDPSSVTNMPKPVFKQFSGTGTVSITIPDNEPAREGHDFLGWKIGGTDAFPRTVAPGGSVEVSASNNPLVLPAAWAESTTNYNVRVMLEQPDGTYQLLGSLRQQGGAGETLSNRQILVPVEAAYPDIIYYPSGSKPNDKGYAIYDHMDPVSPLIKADGTTEITVYFKLKKYTVMFYMGPFGHKIKQGDTTYKNDSQNFSRYTLSNVKVGQSINWPTYVVGWLSGNRWEGWALDDGLFSQPDTYNYSIFTAGMASNADNTNTIVYYLRTTNFGADVLNLEYYLEKEDGTGYEKSSKYSQRIEYSVLASNPEPIQIPGFTYEKDLTTRTNNTIKYYFKRNKAKLQFVSKGVTNEKEVKAGASLANISSGFSDIDNLPAEDDTFVGWFTSSDYAEGTKVNLSTMTMPAEGLVLYAKWNDITVTFLDGPNGAEIAKQTIAKHKKADKPADPSKADKKFGTWLWNGELFHFDTVLDEDTTLTAYWIIPGETFKATYEIPQEYGYTGEAPSDTTNYDPLSTVRVLPAPAIPGYSFVSWTNSYDKKKYSADDTFTIYEGTTLTAEYKKNDEVPLVTIIYDKNAEDAEGSYTQTIDPKINNSTFTLLDESTGKVEFTREGYELVGWRSSAGEGAADYAFATTVGVDVLDAVLDNNGVYVSTVYAAWEQVYTIQFKNYDGTVLQTVTCKAGEKPTYTGQTPTKAATAEYTYTFNGWTPEIAAVTGDATYTATYTEAKNKYTVKFVNEDGTVLQSDELEFGTTPAYTGDEPTKDATAQYTYYFAGWDKEIANVTGDATYTATYTSEVNVYEIRFVDEDKQTVLQDGRVAYGDTPVYEGNTPTKRETDTATYEFDGWDPEIVAVKGEAVYVAKYKETMKETQDPDPVPQPEPTPNSTPAPTPAPTPAVTPAGGTSSSTGSTNIGRSRSSDSNSISTRTIGPNGDTGAAAVLGVSRPIDGVIRVGDDGQWVLVDEATHKWAFELTDGSRIKGRWAYLLNPYAVGDQVKEGWFMFGADGIMLTGWYNDPSNGNWYYLHNVSDGALGTMETEWYYDEREYYWLNPEDGHMMTGWVEIGGKMYYFNQNTPGIRPGSIITGARPYGAMYRNQQTPDGAQVGGDGSRQ